MQSHGLDSVLTQLVSVEAGGSAVVLLLGVRGVAVVRPEECPSSGVAPELHLPQLLPGPVGVKIGGSDEGQVDSKRSIKKCDIIDSFNMILNTISTFIHNDSDLCIPLQSMQMKMP